MIDSASVRLVTRAPGGWTAVKPLLEVAKEKLGTDSPESLPGELWESGLLDDGESWTADDARVVEGAVSAW